MSIIFYQNVNQFDCGNVFFSMICCSNGLANIAIMRQEYFLYDFFIVTVSAFIGSIENY